MNQRSPAKERALFILETLRNEFPGASTELVHADPFQLLIATILSAQTTDVQVNRATSALFLRFPTSRELSEAGIEEIEGYIKTLGFFHSKAKYLKNASLKIQNDFNGTVPETMDELITLPGVGRKTANIVLAHGFGHQEGIAVDTHVKRLSFLLGLTMEQDPVRIEGDLMALIPRDDWALFSDLLILHGRAVCVARKPACGKCRLNRVCPYVQNVSK